MLEITLQPNAASLAVNYAKTPDVIGATVLSALRTIGGGMFSYILREKLQGDPLNRRSGMLGRALFYQVAIDGQDAVLTIGADGAKAPYARAQEYGATITAKNAQNLAIPLEAARTANGVARITARRFMDDPGELGFERAFIAKGVIFGANGKDITPVFALKPSVTLPERSYIRSGVRERQEWILAQLGAAVQKGAENGMGGES